MSTERCAAATASAGRPASRYTCPHHGPHQHLRTSPKSALTMIRASLWLHAVVQRIDVRSSLSSGLCGYTRGKSVPLTIPPWMPRFLSDRLARPRQVTCTGTCPRCRCRVECGDFCCFTSTEPFRGHESVQLLYEWARKQPQGIGAASHPKTLHSRLPPAHWHCQT